MLNINLYVYTYLAFHDINSFYFHISIWYLFYSTLKLLLVFLVCQVYQWWILSVFFFDNVFASI